MSKTFWVIGIVFLIAVVLLLFSFTPYKCVEEQKVYYTRDWGYVYQLGTDYEKALEMAKDRPIDVRVKCVEWK